jgi:hypothetical protein
LPNTLIREHGLQDVYFEGLTEQTLPDLRVRLDLLKSLDRLAALGDMDEAARRHRRDQDRHGLEFRHSEPWWRLRPKTPKIADAVGAEEESPSGGPRLDSLRLLGYR